MSDMSVSRKDSVYSFHLFQWFNSTSFMVFDVLEQINQDPNCLSRRHPRFIRFTLCIRFINPRKLEVLGWKPATPLNHSLPEKWCGWPLPSSKPLHNSNLSRWHGNIWKLWKRQGWKTSHFQNPAEGRTSGISNPNASESSYLEEPPCNWGTLYHLWGSHMALVSSRANFHPQMIHPNPCLEPAGPADRGSVLVNSLADTLLCSTTLPSEPDCGDAFPGAACHKHHLLWWGDAVPLNCWHLRASRGALDLWIYEQRSTSSEGFPNSALLHQTPDLSMQGLAFGAHDFLTVTFRTPRELEE